MVCSTWAATTAPTAARSRAATSCAAARSARDKLTAVDEATGQTLYPWNPAVNTTLGIEALAASGNRVAIGGEFTQAGVVAQQHFARFHE